MKTSVTLFFLLCLLMMACRENLRDESATSQPIPDSTQQPIFADIKVSPGGERSYQSDADVTGAQIVEFAKTLKGVPYKYASCSPTEGFDCSGFITYVFNHFHIEVPRSSVDFTNAGTEVPIQEAREGDLILFTGTIDTIRTVGHIGIVADNSDSLRFIHSSSGKASGVTTSALTDHYLRRFVKVVRILKG